MGDTDLGGWELSAHHRYNFHAGILQKGDGNTVYLKYKPQVRDEFLTFERGENAILKFIFHCIFLKSIFFACQMCVYITFKFKNYVRRWCRP